MPDAETQRQFQELVPDAPERFFRIVESQTVDASARLDRLVDAEIDEARKGRTTATTLMVLCGITAAIFFAFSNTVAGLAFLSVPVLGFLRTLLTRDRSQTRASEDADGAA